MVVNCDIKFDSNPYAIYFAGQTLTGQVELNLDKPKKVRGVSLKISGLAKCQWSESTGVGKRRRTVRYRGHEDYLSTTTYLVGSEVGVSLEILGSAKCQWTENNPHHVNNNTINHNGSQDHRMITFFGHQEYINTKIYLCIGDIENPLELLPGIHTYNFSCSLPQMLPTSFEGSLGHIRYTVRVTLERPWKFDQVYKVAFTVLKQFDLNYDTPLLRIPSQVELNRTFCCGPFKTGPMAIIAHIPQSGYVPGQVIVIQAQVTNSSNVSVDEMRFKLRKIIQYHSQTPYVRTKEEIVDVCERRTGGIPKKDNGRFQQSLTIPSVPPTNVILCRVIHISYEIKIEAKVSGAHLSPVLRIPITIGTVPLSNPNGAPPPTRAITPIGLISDNKTTSQSQTIGSSSQPITNPIFNGGGEQRNSELPPPSYEESIYGTTRINEEDEAEINQKPFAPRYPVYNYGTPAGLMSQTETAAASSNSN